VDQTQEAVVVKALLQDCFKHRVVDAVEARAQIAFDKPLCRPSMLHYIA
jgi:hypothetical protein